MKQIRPCLHGLKFYMKLFSCQFDNLYLDFVSQPAHYISGPNRKKELNSNVYSSSVPPVPSPNTVTKKIITLSHNIILLKIQDVKRSQSQVKKAASMDVCIK